MAPKPRGLKASRLSSNTPFVPPPPAPASSNVDSLPQFPADSDALTLKDLFEIKAQVEQKLSSPGEEEEDEARALLRGILHGCEWLQGTLTSPAPAPAPAPAPSTEEGKEEGAEEQRNKLLKALGLESTERAQSYIHYLQGYALSSLGSILLPPPTPAALSLALGGSGIGKKRKIDLSEPTEKNEWYEEAVGKFEKAWEGAEEASTMQALVGAGWVNALVGLLREEGRAGKNGMGREGRWSALKDVLGKLGELEIQLVQDVVEVTETGEESEEASALDGTPVISTHLLLSEALKAFKSLVDLADSSAPSSATVLPILSLLLSILLPKFSSTTQVLEWALLKSDTAMTRFIVLEEEVEEKYRPEEEEDEDEAEGGEVIPLPVEEKDVKEAREAGEEAIQFLQESIERLTLEQNQKPADGLANVLLAQYKKLEEVYLTYSALFNEDDLEGTERVAKELEAVRKEGGLDGSSGGV